MSEDEEREISVAELREQLQRKGIPLPFEIGAFIALEATEQIVRAPTRVQLSNVWIGEIGEVLVETGAPASEADAVRAVLMLLGDLLVCSAPGVPPMLLELVEHGPSEVDWTLGRLRDDLEACLLPLNRGATRRVLARMLREVQKRGERTSARPAGAPDADALDAELDALLGGEPSPRPVRKPPPADSPSVPAATAPARVEPEPTSTRKPVTRENASPAPLLAPPPSAAEQTPQPAPPPPRTASARKPSPEPAPDVERGPRLRTEDLLVEDEPRGTSGGVVLGGMLFFAAAVLAVAYMTLGQQGARKLLGVSAAERGVAPAGPATESKAAARVAGELRVSSIPERAQVFLFVGTGPALATDLPVGVAQEFVALADGHVAARAVVPADAGWDQVDGQPRYELAMQVGQAAPPGAPLELGSTLLPREVGTPKGPLGTVRVVTAPKGAKVYLLVGFAPNARVTGLALDRSYELLVYLEGHVLERRTVHPEEFRGQGSERVAEVSVSLTRRPRR